MSLFDAESALSHSCHPFLGTDAGYVVRFVNASAVHFFGCALSAIQGKPLQELLSAPPFQPLLRLLQEPAFDFEDPRSGRWYEAGATRSPEGALSIWLHDITSRKKAEHKLRDDESLYRSIFAALHEGIVFLDPGVEIFACNQRAEEILGLTRDEIVGRASIDPRWRAVHEDGSPFPGETHPSSVTLRTGQAMSDVVMGVHKPSGELAWININSEPVVRSGENRPFAAVVSFADITDRKLAEQAVKESEKRFRKVFEESPLGAALLSGARVILKANAALCNLLKYSAAELEGKDFSELIPPGSRPDMASLLDAVFAAGVGQGERDVEGLTKDARQLRLSISASLLGYEEGAEPVGLVMVQDMTARFELESQLRQAQRLESVGRLAGGIAHDFNNLLTVVNGYADMLLKRTDMDKATLNAARQIRTAGGEAANLTLKLLRLARRQTPLTGPVSLNAVVQENLDLLRHLMGADVELKTQLDPGLPSVLADRSELLLVLMNLAVNALDAMPNGGRLTFRTKVADAGDHAAVEVQDTGIGMDEDTQRLIFDPFFSTKSPDKGTGLGLAIVYGIVQQSGGWIELTSAPGAGSTFSVYLPLSTLPAGAAEPVSEPVRGGTETILAVDDQPGVLALVGEILQGYGYSVLLAPGPEEAIAISRNTTTEIELLLSDIVMPGMNGMELAASLRAERPNLRTMFMSAYSDDLQAKRRVIEAGTRLLSKPLQAEVLAAAVRSVLDEPVPEIRTDTLLQTA